MSFVYISYNSADINFARVLRSRIEAEGYNTWMDEQRQPDEQYLAILQNAIASAAAMVVANPRSTAYADLVWWEINTAQATDTPVFNVNKAEEIPRLLEQLEAQVTRQSDYITLPNPLSTDEILALQEIEPERGGLGRVVVAVVVVVAVAAAVAWQTLKSSPPVINTPVRPEPSAPSEELQAGAVFTDEAHEPPFTVTLTPVPTVTETRRPTPAPTSTPRPSASASWTPSPTASATVTTTTAPTHTPSQTATATPTTAPSQTATASATTAPSQTATATPMTTPTRTPRASWVTNTPAP